MKPFNLYISEEHKQAIRDGGTHVAVEWTESESSCSGSVIHVGGEGECMGHMRTKLVVLPHGITAHAAVWESSEVSGLIEQEAK